MVGYLFAGQGSQYIGMGNDLYETFPESKAIFDQAQEVLGWDIKRKCFAGPQDILKTTIILQPAIFAVSIACFEAFKSKFNIMASFAAGLSLGEYCALVVGQALKFEDGLRLVRKRAELMEEVSLQHPGKMAAIIGLDKDEVKNICLVSAGAEVANLNCPGQVVVSGEKAAVDKAKALALQRGAKMTKDLEVNGAFHSSLMRQAAMEFKDFLERTPFDVPKIPVVSNVDGRPKYKVVQIMESLVQQIYKPVLWEESMRFMLSQGITKFFEFGPGKVLKGLMRRIEPSAEVVSIEKKEDILSINAS